VESGLNISENVVRGEEDLFLDKKAPRKYLSDHNSRIFR